MKLDQLNWTAVCCGGHGELAYGKTVAGGDARLKRAPGDPVIQVCRFGIDKDADGVPVYVEMTEAEAMALLA